MIKEINDLNFNEEVYDSDKLVVVDFWAPWCGPCRMLGPVMEELDKEYEGKVKFVKVNVDDNPQISNEFKIHSIPTIMMFKEDEVKDKIVGFLPKIALQSKIKNFV